MSFFVTIDAADLQIQGSAFNAATSGKGDTGDVVVNAENLLLFGAGIETETTGEGRGGDVSITADSTVMQGFDFSSQTSSAASSGDISIAAGNLVFARRGFESDSNSSGTAGNITITAGNFCAQRRGRGLSAAIHQANGGNIDIIAPVIVGTENSDIVANAVSGNGRQIDITTQSLFGLQFRSQRTAESDITASSQFGLDGTVEVEGFELDPNSGLVVLPDGLADDSSEVAKGCGSVDGHNQFIASGRGGLPVSPTDTLHRNRLWTDVRAGFEPRMEPIGQVDSTVTLGSRVSAASPALSAPSENSLIEADGWLSDAAGNIALVAGDDAIAPSNTASCALFARDTHS
ncbi:MAG: S-layer family protein [Cyanobacteria bacterium J06626_6]